MQIPDNILSLPRISLYLEHFALSNNNLSILNNSLSGFKSFYPVESWFWKKGGMGNASNRKKKKKIYKDSRVKKF